MSLPFREFWFLSVGIRISPSFLRQRHMQIPVKSLALESLHGKDRTEWGIRFSVGLSG
ncbi:MAG: hypothetical protein P8K66_03885 [Planctomycetota bacterium]|nr:hypothetical protein [Planctomycetota bacterium]